MKSCLWPEFTNSLLLIECVQVQGCQHLLLHLFYPLSLVSILPPRGADELIGPSFESQLNSEWMFITKPKVIDE